MHIGYSGLEAILYQCLVLSMCNIDLNNMKMPAIVLYFILTHHIRWTKYAAYSTHCYVGLPRSDIIGFHLMDQITRHVVCCIELQHSV